VGALPAALRPKNQIFGHAMGMTETGGPHTISFPDYPDELAGTLGPPMPGMEHKLVDIHTGREVAADEAGELLIRGDALMSGFVKRERDSCFDADGWYHTGDLCTFRQGHIFFLGRLDDTIKSSGANVSPREVEEALVALPGVAQAIVLGVPDEQRGGVVGAILIPAQGAQLDEAAIRRSLAKTLSVYKIPRVLMVMTGRDWWRCCKTRHTPVEAPRLKPRRP
jgi:acyl-CoA synthetase (AMP-forming)/AMP-acid ligase II